MALKIRLKTKNTTALHYFLKTAHILDYNLPRNKKKLHTSIGSIVVRFSTFVLLVQLLQSFKRLSNINYSID